MNRRPILFLILSCLALRAFPQNGWDKLYSTIVNGYSASEIRGLTADGAGNLYAAINQGVYKWTGSGWTPLPGFQANAQILKLATDASGNVYAAGWFTNSAGNLYVAKWNGSTWSELGTGSNGLNETGSIYDLYTDAAGNVYAGGSFSNDNARNYVAKWNGTSWSELGGPSGLNANGFIWAIMGDASGNIYAAGNFVNAAGKRYVAKWNGTTWSELGSGAGALNANLNILELATGAGGQIYAAGQFTNAAGKSYVAQWNGSSWSELPSFPQGNAGWIWTLSADNNGNLYAAGELGNGTAYCIYKWNGTAWSEVNSAGSTLNGNGIIYTLLLQNGSLYAAGAFANAGGNKYVARWNGSSWTELGINGSGAQSFTGVRAITLTAAGIYAGGRFFNSGGQVYIARWDGNIWSQVGDGFPGDPTVNALVHDAAGNLYAAGTIRNDNFTYYVARWDGSHWTEVGTGAGQQNPNGPVSHMGIDAAGNLYVCGSFTNASGKYYVAKWDGTTWSELGTGANALNNTVPISDLKVMPSGVIYAGANHFNSHGQVYYVARWNGTTWSEVGPANTGFSSEDPFSLAVDGAGNVYAFESILFNNPSGPSFRKWDGTSWTTLRVFTSGSPTYLEADAAGNIYIGGTGTSLKYSGGQFLPMGSLHFDETLRSLAFDANGTIYGGGSFQIGSDGYGVARYDAQFLPVPVLSGVHDICLNGTTATAKLSNPPANGTLTITMDGNPLSFQSTDSSFVYANTATAAGSHTVRVRYANSAHTVQIDSSFAAEANLPATATLSGGTSGTQTISCTVSNAGTHPSYLWQDSTLSGGWNNIASAQGPTLSYTWQPGARLRCRVTSSALCTNGVVSTSNVLQFAFPTALPLVDAYPELRVYPNPGQRFVDIEHLNLSEDWKDFVLVNAAGIQVATGSLTRRTSVRIATEPLPAGVYLLLLRQRSGKTFSIKWVKN